MRLSLAAIGVLAVTVAAPSAFPAGAPPAGSPVPLPAFPPPDTLPSTAEFPDPLVMRDGTKIATKKDWEEKRRPELKELFQHYMYGRFPAKPEKVTAKVLFEDTKALGGKGTLREVELTFGPPEWPKLYLLIAAPNGTPPVACFVGPNFGGNHLLTAHEQVRVPTVWVPGGYPGVEKGTNRATAEGRGKQADTWPLQQIVESGYAVATFYCGDVQPDRPGVSEGMRATLPAAKDAPPADETATVMWWAWGCHRAVDFLVTDPRTDAKRLAVVGHSRLGKTALLAGAFDDRIAVVIPHQSGCGGAGPSRSKNPKAEPVKRITTVFPHWFCANFRAFGDDTTKIPFDQHSLVAICAPRPVLATNADDDQWANPPGQFDVLTAAAPVYRLYGDARPVAAKLPETGTLADERLGYFVRAGKHSMTPDDWKVFTRYADKWLK
ncbi:glucuronyl esterase domain-containing protein [Frigoriglobus tundricola]|uniref:4-O-methyl-glucuronoyl methylesterase n=1 Tax=Frigoriglobus tundricola TaxID=2774151 RepID=A0A6M5YKV1_9BACT|nr:acetylxylan esterase [Frigoriglobus tundricola]QJW94575.1 4-O-methyl-glucuronoyl methylesterase [Frigoriglobus tundricola]